MNFKKNTFFIILILLLFNPRNYDTYRKKNMVTLKVIEANDRSLCLAKLKSENDFPRIDICWIRIPDFQRNFIISAEREEEVAHEIRHTKNEQFIDEKKIFKNFIRMLLFQMAWNFEFHPHVRLSFKFELQIRSYGKKYKKDFY